MCLIYDDKLFTKEVEEELSQRRALVKETCKKYKHLKTYFQRKTSLLELREKRNDFDVLYLRNRGKWNIGGLKGIGKNINHTIAFLKKEFAKYDKVICVGGSAGGYASLLFGSLLQVDSVVAMDAQTDLNYLIDRLSPKNQQMMDFQKRKKDASL